MFVTGCELTATLLAQFYTVVLAVSRVEEFCLGNTIQACQKSSILHICPKFACLMKDAQNPGKWSLKRTHSVA